MSDFHEQDTWDQGEVEIVDLGAPDKGLSRSLFTLGEKWHAAASLRVRLVALVVALGLLITVLQPGSSLVNHQTSGTHHTIPTYSLPHIIFNIECASVISITPGQDSQGITWQPSSSTASAQWVVIVCDSVTPMPVPSGNVGKHP